MATKTSFQRLASWIFGGITFAFLIGVFVFGPDELPEGKQHILGIMCAVLAGLFGYFFTGSMKLVTEGKLPKWGKISIQASGGVALFVLVLLWWGSIYAPVNKTSKETIDEIDHKTDKITHIINFRSNPIIRMSPELSKTLHG